MIEGGAKEKPRAAAGLLGRFSIVAQYVNCDDDLDDGKQGGNYKVSYTTGGAGASVGRCLLSANGGGVAAFGVQ